MTKIDEVLDTAKLEYLISEKRINKQVHPTLPLTIYNYSARAQYVGEWTNEERVCRGLIVDDENNVIARGPSKFFNYGQPGAPEVTMDSDVAVYRKEDGSLGIGWEYNGHYGIATRGSFASDQALHATELGLRHGTLQANVDFAKEFYNATPIYEVVYSANRIVLDYGNRDENIFLGKVSNETGLIIDRPNPEDDENGFFKGYMKFSDAVALPIPDDEEGYVLDIIDWSVAESTGHLKLKGENYVRLHGAIFGLSERKIWEVFGEDLKKEHTGDVMTEFISGLPDELQPWADKVWENLEQEYREIYSSIELGLVFVWMKFGDEFQLKENRRDVAIYIKDNYPDHTGPMFSGLDERWDSVSEWVHKQIKPEHKLFRTESEDTN